MVKERTLRLFKQLAVLKCTGEFNQYVLDTIQPLKKS